MQQAPPSAIGRVMKVSTTLLSDLRRDPHCPPPLLGESDVPDETDTTLRLFALLPRPLLSKPSTLLMATISSIMLYSRTPSRQRLIYEQYSSNPSRIPSHPPPSNSYVPFKSCPHRSTLLLLRSFWYSGAARHNIAIFAALQSLPSPLPIGNTGRTGTSPLIQALPFRLY